MRPPARLSRTACSARRAAGALALLAALGRAGPVPAATLVIYVQTPDGHALSGAVVTARPLDGQGKRPAPVHAVMDQVNRAFAPDLLVVPVGSTVAFPNSDSVSHQIYSFSAAKLPARSERGDAHIAGPRRDRSGRRLADEPRHTAGDLGCRTRLHGRRSRHHPLRPQRLRSATRAGAARAERTARGAVERAPRRFPLGRQGPQPLGSDRGVSAVPSVP